MDGAGWARFLAVACWFGCDAPTPPERVMGEFAPLEICDFIQTDEEGARFISIDDYILVNHRVAPTLDEHLANFENACMRSEWQYDGCSGKLYSGCGLVQYEPFGDESYYRMYNYDAQTGQLIGALSGTDTATYCPDGSPTVNSAGLADVVLSNTECDDTAIAYCCGRRNTGSN